jgi:hypothetical protein
VLQERDTAKITVCKEYLHYLMTGLEALPSYSPSEGVDAVLWRGVNRSIKSVNFGIKCRAGQIK